MRAYEIHPLAGVFPEMDEASYRDLVKSISENGVIEPIILWDGMILDGRHRYRACVELGITALNIKNAPANADPVAYVLAKNLHRRHMDASQRAMVAARIANIQLGDNQYRKVGPPIGGPTGGAVAVSQTQAARMLNASPRSVQRAQVVLKHGVPELQTAVVSGLVGLGAAEVVATKAADEQREIMSQGPVAVAQAAKKVKEERATEKRAKMSYEDQLTIADRVAKGERAEDIAREYGLATRHQVASIIASVRNSAIQVPDGSTVEAQVRSGMALELDGASVDEAAKHAGLGEHSYRRVRELIVLRDEIPLRPADCAAVAKALEDINTRKNLGPHDDVAHIITRVWGTKMPYHTAEAARRRLDQFNNVVGRAVEAIGILASFDMPYLPTDMGQKWIKELRGMQRNNGAVIRRIEEECR